MGWRVTIKCDEEIWVEELEQIVEDLPDQFRGFIPKKEHMRQPSGFPTYATIELPIKNTVCITGSYIMTTVEKSLCEEAEDEDFFALKLQEKLF